MTNKDIRNFETTFYGMCTTLVIILIASMYVYITKDFSIGLILDMITAIVIILLGIVYSLYIGIKYKDYNIANFYLFILPGLIVIISITTLQQII